MPAPVVAIVQARMGSTRLPGKVMKPILGRPMLEHLLERLARVPNLDAIVVATTTAAREAPIVELVEALPAIALYRGSEDDVLARYHGAARAAGAATVVRITSDCPLLDPAVVARCVDAFIARQGSVDYVSNALVRSYPRGLDTEVFSFEALETAFREATEAPDREHVTPFLWRQPERFRLLNVAHHEDRSDLRWTVDTQEDLELVTRIYGALHARCPRFGFAEILALLERHPAWSELNRHVEQKPYGG